MFPLSPASSLILRTNSFAAGRQRSPSIVTTKSCSISAGLKLSFLSPETRKYSYHVIATSFVKFNFCDSCTSSFRAKSPTVRVASIWGASTAVVAASAWFWRSEFSIRYVKEGISESLSSTVRKWLSAESFSRVLFLN